MISNGSIDDAIQNAIIDFSKTSSLRKDDNAFSVSVYDINNEVLGVVIFGDANPEFIGLDTAKNSFSYSTLPTRYVEYNNKLFYWHDSTKNVSDEVISALLKYNKLDTFNISQLIPDMMIDDSKKSADYYFCKSNLKKYKKVTNSIAIGWYDSPRLNCSSK